MSSLRNAVKRKTHKERAQPAARHKFGLLEKKKDYLQRARHHQKQESVLQVLREKAETKNPDEFYQAMQREHMHGGPSRNKRLPDRDIRHLKTQDLLHVQLAASKHSKRLEKMQKQLHFIGAPVQNHHTVFVESSGAIRNFKAADYFDTEEKLLDRSFNRPRKEQLDGATGGTAAAPAAARVGKRTAAAYQRLVDEQATCRQLQDTAVALAAKRAASGRGRKRKVNPGQGVSGVSQTVFRRIRQK